MALMIQLSFTAHNPCFHSGNMFPLLCILLVAFTGFCEGAGVLPDDPLLEPVGGSVVFNTTNIGAKPPFTSVTWLFDSKTILISQSSGNLISPDYEGRVTYYSSTVSLELRNLTVNDSGLYGISILASGGFEEGRTNLKVIEGPSDPRADPVSVDMVEFSGPVSLTCSSSGFSLSYVWRKDNSEVTASDRVQITDGGTKLTITNVTREDDGEYYCIVSNPVSSASSNRVIITINYGPENIKLTSPNPVKPVEVGSDINMECSAESRPSAEFTWFVNETLLPDVGPKLKLTNVTTDQSGSYSCQAFNPKTKKNQTSEPLQITILERISDASVSHPDLPVEGTTVNLTCEASGSVWTRDWMKGGSDLVLTDNMKLYDNNRVLAFNTVTRSDTGLYVCKIGNPINNMEASYPMVVNYGPEKVTITVDKPNVVVEDTITLKCSAESVPPANFTWLFNGTERPELSAELIITNINSSASGNYTCKATNEITGKTSSGEKILSVRAELPDPPQSTCGAGCIAGIVIAVIVVIGVAAGVGYNFCQKRSKTTKSTNTNTPTVPSGARDNAANTPDVNYADIRSFQKKSGERINLGQRDPETIYSDVKVNNNPPAAPSLPTYDSHMQRQRTAGPTYAQVQKNRTQ